MNPHISHSSLSEFIIGTTILVTCHTSHLRSLMHGVDYIVLPRFYNSLQESQNCTCCQQWCQKPAFSYKSSWGIVEKKCWTHDYIFVWEQLLSKHWSIQDKFVRSVCKNIEKRQDLQPHSEWSFHGLDWSRSLVWDDNCEFIVNITDNSLLKH
jgi:hypothetical protein